MGHSPSSLLSQEVKELTNSIDYSVQRFHEPEDVTNLSLFLRDCRRAEGIHRFQASHEQLCRFNNDLPPPDLVVSSPPLFLGNGFSRSEQRTAWKAQCPSFFSSINIYFHHSGFFLFVQIRAILNVGGDEVKTNAHFYKGLLPQQRIAFLSFTTLHDNENTELLKSLSEIIPFLLQQHLHWDPHDATFSFPALQLPSSDIVNPVVPSSATLAPTSASSASRLPSPPATLIHCAAGMSRSPTIVIAYLMLILGLSLEQSARVVCAAHPYTCPNSGFLKQLLELEKAIIKKKWTSQQQDPVSFLLNLPPDPVDDGSRLFRIRSQVSRSGLRERVLSAPSPDVNAVSFLQPQQ